MVSVDALDSVLPQADFVVLATPLTKDTHRLLDARRIGLMKRGAGFFNIGRGGSVDHDALAKALRSGALSGALVDVFDPEPLPANSPLWHADNLLLTPHVTSDDPDEYLPKTFDLVFENVRRQRASQGAPVPEGGALAPRGELGGIAPPEAGGASAPPAALP